MSEQARKKRIDEALNALAPDCETLRVPWRGQQVRLPIIRIELESAVLNPRSHRIKAQLESNRSASQFIAQDPDSDEAQESIRGLLRETPGFDSLRQNVADEGQLHAGIITRDGRLINANTRAVALLDLGSEYIEAAVLPADATLGEVYDLELDLQVAQDYKQDYSFTNELLFVEDMITEQSRNEKDVALRLRWATSAKPASIKTGIAKVQRYVRHLDLIRDIQKLSGGQVPLTYFDDAEQTLIEFDVAYEGLRNKDPIAAQQMKQARVLGLLVDLGYERQRQVDANWVETFLSEALSEQEDLRDLLGPIAEGVKNAPPPAAAPESDLDEFDDYDGETPHEGDPIHTVVDVLVRALGTSARDDKVKIPTSTGEKEFDRDVLSAAINDAMRAAAEDAKGAAKAGSELKLPTHLVDEAAKRLTKARASYAKVSTHADFDDKALRNRIDEATRALDALKLIVGD